VSEPIQNFTERARKVLTLAQEEAQNFGHNYIGTEHLLLGLLRETDGIAGKILFSFGIGLEKTRLALQQIIGRGDQPHTNVITLTPRSKKVLEKAVEEAHRLNQHIVGTEHLLLGLISEKDGLAAAILENMGLKLHRVREHTLQAIIQPDYTPARQEEKMSNIGAEMTPPVPSPAAPTFPVGQSLVKKARTNEFDPLVGREKELDRMLRILMRRNDPHVLLVGESGVGKTALVNGLAQWLVTDPPPGFEGVDIVQVNHSFLAQYVPIAKWKPDLSSGKIIFYVPEGLLNSSLLAAFYDLLNRAGVRIISSITPEGLKRFEEQQPGLLRRFQPVRVKPTDETETIKILRDLNTLFEQHHKVWIDDGGLEMALLLSEKYITDREQPGAALDLLDEACAMVALRRKPVLSAAEEDEEVAIEEIRESPVTAFEVLEVVSGMIGKTIEELEKELDEDE
jgi:ATP-dependent Clp protease ATP-binding subunit ClpC